MSLTIKFDMDFPGGLVVKNTPCNAGDIGWIPGRGTKPMHCNQPETACLNYGAHQPQLWSPPAAMKIPHDATKTHQINKYLK